MSVPERSRLLHVLLVCACIVVIVAGMRAAASILVPFLLALFTTLLVVPWYISLQRRGLPPWLALTILTLVLLVLGGLCLVVVGTALAGFVGDLPDYQTELRDLTGQLSSWLQDRGVLDPGARLIDAVDPQAVMRLVGTTASNMSDLLGTTFIIIIIVVFCLLEAGRLPDRLRSIPELGGDNWERLSGVVDRVRRYVALKTILSLATGALVTLLLWLLGVENALVMGLLAFLLNYIPSIGSIIAAIPGVLLALLQHGVGVALWTAGGYLVINVVIGNVIEPRLVGRGVGLSPLIIVITMILWGWVLGPVGMLLAVPLTMVGKIVLESMDETRSIGVFMGSSAPAE
jgi:predicted PurR-regulated permease PerM